MADQRKSPATDPAQPPMFGTLLASKPKHGLAGAMGSTVGSIVIHGVIIAGLVYATAKAAAAPAPDAPINLISLADAPPPPPPPPPPPMDDVPPPVATAEPIAKGFQTLAVPDIVPPTIPPPQVGVVIRPEDFSARGLAGGRGDGDSTSTRTTNDLIAAPVMVPMTVPPKLLNQPAVEASIRRNYPSLLKDAGIGGTTKVWFFIDENGRSIKQQVKEPSGYPALDDAAMKVAPVLRFTPAQNQDKKIPVWVSIDIVFKVN